jgi:hypothetical protein
MAGFVVAYVFDLFLMHPSAPVSFQVGIQKDLNKKYYPSAFAAS